VSAGAPGPGEAGADAAGRPGAATAPAVALGASIVVCTHNRAGLVADALRSVALLGPVPGGMELILVDNASTDETPTVAREALAAVPFAARYVREETVGLSHARNRAVAEARGEVVAFLDDDAICRPGWLRALLDVYAAHADAECVGGKAVLDWTEPPPTWWTPALDHHLSAVDYGDRVIRLRYPDFPYGVNISFHRRVFERGHRFDPALGRRGRALGAGEELALALAVERDGGAVYYAPDAQVLHRADRSRANARYLYAKSYLHGRCAARIESAFFGRESGLRTAGRFAAQGIAQFLNPRRTVALGCEWRFRAGYLLETLRPAAG